MAHLHLHSTSPAVQSGRPWRFPLDPGILILLIAPLIAIYPLLPAGLPATADGPLHLIRSVEFDAILRDGTLYPRWAPDLAYGYGYPLFNFYAPLFYYLTEIPHLLGASFEAALKLVIFACYFLYGFAMYWWMRPFLGSGPAVVAGVAYTFFPFRFHETYVQGDYPQFLAWAIAPLAFGSVYHLFAADQVRFSQVLALILSLGAILLTHNISALWLAPALAGYAGLLAIQGGLSRSPRLALRRVGIAAGAATLACGLTAFFWLPALAEQGLVQLNRLRTDDYDVRHSFINLATLLTPPRVVDQTAANAPLYLHLGWGELALALATIPLLAALAGASRGKFLRTLPIDFPAHLVFAWAMLPLTSWLTLPSSYVLWQHLALFAYTQFPWRVLQLSALALAVLAGVATYLALRVLANRKWPTMSDVSTLVIAVAMVVLIVPSLVYLYPHTPFQVSGALTPADVTAFERNGGAVGTTSTGEYYPTDVTDRPIAALPGDFRTSGRLDHTSLPVGSRADFTPLVGDGELYALSLPAPGTLRFNLIRFAGWQAWIDGEPVATRVTDGQGLLLVDVPAGTHTLTLQFADTPLRREGWILALASALILVSIGVGSRVHVFSDLERLSSLESPSVPDSLSPIESVPTATIPRRSVLALGAVPFAFLTLRVWSPPFYNAVFARRSPLDVVIGAAHTSDVRFGNSVELVGYDLSSANAQAGQPITVTLYWRALTPLSVDYRSLAMVARVGDQGLLAQDDRVHPGGIPSRTWRTDHYVIDEHTITIPNNAPPMVYQLQVALYDPQTGAHLPVDGLTGSAAGQAILQRIHVAGPVPNRADFRDAGNPDFGGKIKLLGYRVNSQQLKPGQDLQVTLLWQAEAATDVDYTVFVHLIDAHQNQGAGEDNPPMNGQYPTSAWLAGEEIADTYTIHLPTNLAAGDYHLAIGLYDSKTMNRLTATSPSWQDTRSQLDLDNFPIHITTP